MPNYVQRLRARTLQSRLALTQDRIRRKVIDNAVSLVSTPVDCIRLVPRSHPVEGDPVSWICEKADVVSVAFPPLENVPVRKIRKDKETNLYQMTSLVSSFEDGEQSKFFTCQSPIEHDVDVGDLLVRVMMDDNTETPTVFLLQVTELLGTFGGREIIQSKYNCTIPTVQIPQDVINTIIKMIKRRQRISF